MKPLILPLILGAAFVASAQETVTKDAIAKLNAAPAAVPSATTVQAASTPIAVALTTSKTTYRNGEIIDLTLETPRQGHIRIFYKDATGEVTRLFPDEALNTEASKFKAKLNDIIPAGKHVISGANSITGIRIEVAPPHFGAEEVAVVITDFAVQEDGPILSQLKLSKTAADAALVVAGEAIRQDVAVKSGIARVNASGVPKVLTSVGIQTVKFTTTR